LKKDKLLEKWKLYEQVFGQMEVGGKILDDIWLNVASKVTAGKSDTLPWNTFLESFLTRLGVSITQNQKTLKCLRYFFQVKQDTDLITENNFELFKNIFKSLFPSSPNEGKGNKFLTSICDLYEQEFFFGFQTRPEAEEILNKYKDEAFLVRISRKENRLILSCKKMSDPHKIIEHEHYGTDGAILVEYVQENLKKDGYFVVPSKNELIL